MNNAKHTRLHLRTVTLLFATLMVLTWSTAAGAQAAGTAGLEIYLHDASGAAMAGASVSMEQKATHVTRVGVTDKNGLVRFENIPAGDYVLTARRDGFAEVVERSITLTAGGKSVVHLNMQAASANKQTGGETPTINTESSAPGETVSKSEVVNLPKESSNSIDFSLSVANSSDQQSSVMGSSITEQQTTEQASAINASGHRVNSNYFLLDGVENNGQLIGSVRNTLPLETVSQYQVLTGQNSAEYGTASSAITNILTKSGSDQLRGSLYYNARNGILNASPYCFNNPNGCPNSDVYNSEGGTLGGRLYKEKTFFFASMEYTGTNRFNIDLTPNNYPIGSVNESAVNGALPKLIGSSVTSLYLGNVPVSTAQTLFSFRLDHTFNKNNTLMVRVLYAQSTHANTTNDCGSRQFSDLSNCGSDGLRASSFVGSYTHIFSPTLLNEFHMQYSPEYVTQHPNSTGPAAYILLVTQIGQNYQLPSKFDESHYGWSDALIKTTGKHLFKFGADVLWLRMYNYSPIQQQGKWEFDTIGDFTKATPDPYRLTQQFGNFNLQEGDTATSYYAQDTWRVKPRLTLSYGLRYDVDYQPQGYNQNLNDPIQAPLPKGIPDHYLNFAPRVGVAWSLNKSGKTIIRAGYGLFYDKILTIASRNLLLSRQELFLSSSTNYLASPTNYPGIPACETIDMYKNGPFPSTYSYPTSLPSSVTSDASCMATPGAGLPKPSIYELNNSLPTPSVLQGTVSLDQQLSQNWSINVSFINANGLHRLKATNINLPPPVILTSANASTTPYWQQLGRPYFSLARLNPNYLNIITYGSWGHSTYNNLTGTIIHRTSHNLTLSASWTWSHEIDDASDFTSGQEPDDVYNPHAERADGLQDQRHRFTLTGVYLFPYRIRRNAHNPPLRWALGNWEASTNAVASSGSPYNITIGHNVNGDTSVGVNRPYVNGLNGMDGGRVVGRNAFRGARKQNVSLRLQKEFPFTRVYRATMSVEAFNLFNHVNFGTPYQYWGEDQKPDQSNPGGAPYPLVWGRPMDISSSCVECSETFGAWTTAGAGRTIQLSARFNF